MIDLDDARSEYVGDNVATVYPRKFPVLDKTHVKVVLTQNDVDTELLVDSEYTVQGVGETEDDTNWNVTYPVSGSPLTPSQRLTIVPHLPLTQLVDFSSQGPFRAQTHEEVADYLTIITQQLQEQIDRCVMIPVGSDADLSTLVADILALAASNPFGTWRGDWVTATAYHLNDVFKDPVSKNLYITLIAHTSTNIASDLAAVKLALLFDASAGFPGSVKKTLTETAHGFIAGNIIRHDGTNYVKAQAVNTLSLHGLYIVESVVNANSFVGVQLGEITLSGLTAGQSYYVDPTTAGAVTTTRPTGAGQVPVVAFRAISTTRAVVVFRHQWQQASQADMEAAAAGTNFVVPANMSYHPGMVKAWVQFNGTGTIAVTAGLNYSSLTDSGTGSYLVNLLFNFSSANYCVLVSGGKFDATNDANFAASVGTTAILPTASAVPISTGTGDTPTLRDHTRIYVAVLGDW